MKYLILFILFISLFFLTGCATVAHKDITTKVKGMGVDITYTSKNTINPEDIPAFIKAVEKLEELINDI